MMRWVPERRLEALALYRKYGTCSEGVTLRELAQWDALDRLRPKARLCMKCFTPYDLLLAPRTNVTAGQSTVILPELSPQQILVCQTIERHTKNSGVCTRIDLCHALWNKYSCPDRLQVLEVQVCNTNKMLAAKNSSHRIAHLWGRGYEWSAV